MIEPIASEGLLRQGVAAAKDGNDARARALLLEAAETDPHIEMTWLWLASVSLSPEEAIGHLERALTINPFNQRARVWLMKIRARALAESAFRPRGVEPSRARRRRDASVGEPNVTRASRRWRCPICDQCFIVKPIRCVRCQSVQSLADLWVFFEDVDVDTERVEIAVERLQNDKTLVPALRHRNLGLALLNLQRFRQGVIQLAAAAALSPQDSALGKLVNELLGRLNRGQAQQTQAQQAQPQASMSNPGRYPA